MLKYLISFLSCALILVSTSLPHTYAATLAGHLAGKRYASRPDPNVSKSLGGHFHRTNQPAISKPLAAKVHHHPASSKLLAQNVHRTNHPANSKLLAQNVHRNNHPASSKLLAQNVHRTNHPASSKLLAQNVHRTHYPATSKLQAQNVHQTHHSATSKLLAQNVHQTHLPASSKLLAQNVHRTYRSATSKSLAGHFHRAHRPVISKPLAANVHRTHRPVISKSLGGHFRRTHHPAISKRLAVNAHRTHHKVISKRPPCQRFMYRTHYPDLSKSLKLLLDKYEKQKRFKEMLVVLDNELCRDPYNPILLYHKAGVYADLEQYDLSIDLLKRVLQLQPDYDKAIQLLCKVEELWAQVPHNEIGISQDENYVNDLHSTWSYTSLHYYRFTRYGTFGGRVNYANRFGQGGEQYLLELYPVFNKYFSLTLIGGISNTSERVFPKYYYWVEPYFYFPCDIEVSIGKRFIRNFDKNIHTYTGSIGKYFYQYWFVWFRPYHFTPGNKNFYELGLRKYFCQDYLTYLTIKLGKGSQLDIGDVPPFNEIVGLRATSIFVDVQFPVVKNVYLKLGTGYIRQKYDTGLHREIYDGFVGIIWQL